MRVSLVATLVGLPIVVAHLAGQALPFAWGESTAQGSFALKEVYRAPVVFTGPSPTKL
jgi:hypothetical protein